MVFPSHVIAAVSQQLDAFFTAQHDATADFGPQAAIMRDAAAAAVRGGKRLRAQFCMAGYAAVAPLPGDALPTEAVAVAASLELFHAAALVHDDLIDNSDIRRGHPSSHRGLEAAHRAAGWHGDAAAFGRAGALLVGDLLVAFSDDLFEDGLRTAAADRAAAARQHYARMRRDVTMGQFLDVAEESAFATAPDSEHAERALRVASLKSARYTVEQPLLIGACLAGAADELLRSLSAYGHPVGMAFQLRDDILGVFGDEQVTGKPSGDDLREGKRTLLIAYAMEGLDFSGRAALEAGLGDASLDDTAVAALQHRIEQSGARARVERLIEDYTASAARALADADLPDDVSHTLHALTRAAVQRAA